MSKRSFSPLLVLGHMVNDTSAYMLSGLLPVLTTLFSLSYLLAGVIAMVFNVTSSIMQPLLGRWFDRTQAAWLLEAGLALNCIGMSLVGISPNYVLLLFFIGTAGLGSAAFHPPAFSAVIRSSASSRGSAMGIFISGGNAGVFLGPIVAGAIVSSFGLQGTLLMLPIGLVTAPLLLRIGTQRKEDLPLTAEHPQPANTRLLALLASITALRSIAIQSVATFLPLYFVAKGDSLFIATAIASLWLGLGVLGQLGGGFISDRIGRRPVIIASLLLGALFFYGFLGTNGYLSLLSLALSGLLLYASWSVIVVMSSEAAPSNVGAVSGFMLGFSVGIGGLAAVAFGAVGDILGLTYAFYLVTASAFFGGLMGLLLPRRI